MASLFDIQYVGKVDDPNIIVEFICELDDASKLLKSLTKSIPIISAYTSTYLRELSVEGVADIKIPIVNKVIRVKVK